jgi:xylulokinase
MSYLGVDLGTTGCKAAAFDAAGAVLASSYREYPLLSPEDGRAELDSGRVIADCLNVIRAVAHQCAADPVRALAISSQGEAFTPVDRSGVPLCNVGS